MSSKFSVLLSVLTLYSVALAQRQQTSDPQALALAAKSATALTGGNSVSDATLTGNATWISGSDNETGTVTLRVKGTAESRIDLALSGGYRSDFRNDTAGYPQGASVNGSGGQQAWPTHNCWINASWFFPPLSFLTTPSDATLIFSDVGQESWNGIGVQHVRIYRYLSGQKPTTISLTEQLSKIDIYLDAASFLPVAFVFNIHPEDNAMSNIRVEVDFSQYQQVNGIQVPFHVQKLVNGGLALDLQLNGAVFNSGLEDSLFSIQGQ